MPERPILPNAAAPAVEILAAGDEVLNGDVLDTNTHELCVLVTGLGGRVSRTTTVRDDVETIAHEIRAALARRPALLFTVGGLGPTDDDRTLEGVALGTGRALGLHAEAERMVAERYAEFHARGDVPFAGLNEARRKMARLPAGAEPADNPIGGAPGVVLEVDDTTIVSLPGVPGELRAIVRDSLAELFARLFGVAHYEERALVVELQDESAIADVLRAAAAAHPAVYVKSRAKVIGSAPAIRITLSARGPDAATVGALLEAAAADVGGGVTAAGFGIRAETAATSAGD
ncbi:MAG TPA: competence/damage-inducible protein A [Thermoleophilia bacterium]|nr:competence/damage-inducible protein A [Thermoleophilia bacterium]